MDFNAAGLACGYPVRVRYCQSYGFRLHRLESGRFQKLPNCKRSMSRRVVYIVRLRWRGVFEFPRSRLSCPHDTISIGICQGVSAVILDFFPYFFASLKSTLDVRNLQRWVRLFCGLHLLPAVATFVIVLFSFFHAPIIHTFQDLSTPKAAFSRILSKFFVC